jgi:hypothetical protein
MVGDKFRFRFRKADGLRLVSHHDLMRCGERMLRRADLPFRMTGGFHPTPRLVFALSLPLGMVGHNEVVELELTRPLDSDEVLDRLRRQAPAGLTLLGVRVVPMNASAVPRRAVYRLPLAASGGRKPPVGACGQGRAASPGDPTAGLRPSLAGAIDALLAQDQVWVDRHHPRPRRVNIRPYIRTITAADGAINFDLWVTGQGTAKGDELARLLGLADVLTAGAVFERLDLEIADEVTDATDGPPTGPPETLPLNHAPVGAGADRDTTAEPAVWGLSPNGPVVE